jgi:hypothetical protein
MKATTNLDARLTYAFRRVVCRAPTDHDIVILRRAYAKQSAIYKSNITDAKALTSAGASPRDESLDITEHAALSAVCLAILNLDEALTRE